MWLVFIVQKKVLYFKIDISRALVRPGRFDSRVTVPMPDVRARKSILELHLGKVELADGKNIRPCHTVFSEIVSLYPYFNMQK